MSNKIEAIEMLETRTVHSKQRARGTKLVVGEDIKLENAIYFINRKEAKAVKAATNVAEPVSKPVAKKPSPKKESTK